MVQRVQQGDGRFDDSLGAGHHRQRRRAGKASGSDRAKTAMKILVTLALAAASLCAQEGLPGAAAADEQINEAVKHGLIPGGVLLVGHDGNAVYRKAYGELSLVPKREPMTVDTIFDAASLTTVVATTSGIVQPDS